MCIYLHVYISSPVWHFAANISIYVYLSFYIWLSHVALLSDSYRTVAHTHICVTSHPWLHHVTKISMQYEIHTTYLNMFDEWMRHVTHMIASSDTNRKLIDINMPYLNTLYKRMRYCRRTIGTCRTHKPYTKWYTWHFWIRLTNKCVISHTRMLSGTHTNT